MGGSSEDELDDLLSPRSPVAGGGDGGGSVLDIIGVEEATNKPPAMSISISMSSRPVGREPLPSAGAASSASSPPPASAAPAAEPGTDDAEAAAPDEPVPAPQRESSADDAAQDGAGQAGGAGASGDSSGTAAETGFSVFVGNLAFAGPGSSLEELKQHFGRVEGVQDVKLIMKAGGKSKGAGLVQFRTQEQAAAAIRQLDKSRLGGRQLTVREDVQDASRRPPPRHWGADERWQHGPAPPHWGPAGWGPGYGPPPGYMEGGYGGGYGYGYPGQPGYPGAYGVGPDYGYGYGGNGLAPQRAGRGAAAERTAAEARKAGGTTRDEGKSATGTAAATVEQATDQSSPVSDGGGSGGKRTRSHPLLDKPLGHPLIDKALGAAVADADTAGAATRQDARTKPKRKRKGGAEVNIQTEGGRDTGGGGKNHVVVKTVDGEVLVGGGGGAQASAHKRSGKKRKKKRGGKGRRR